MYIEISKNIIKTYQRDYVESMKFWIRNKWIHPILILFASTVDSQNLGSISGSITDDSSGESLPGVSILLEDTRLGTTTDIKGRFHIPNVEPGTYFLQASIIGYRSYKAKVKISQGQETQLDFHLHLLIFQIFF